MKRKLYLVILLAISPSIVNALGLGKLDLNSALNEPFDARILLLSPTADELDSLKVGLADSEAFARAKVDRPFLLSKLKFVLHRSVDEGPDYIRVYSKDPIREPFLNFLVDVNWSNGRLFREYTVLLDPPLYDPNARASEFKKSATISESASTAATGSDNNVVYADEFEKYNGEVSSPRINYAGGDYGPTTGSDTLWSIASAMRPDSSISVNKMMLALLKANPEAFFNQNINGLKRGQILRMPAESEINSLNNAEALAEVQSQYAAWEDIKGNLSSTVTERPEVSSVSESSDSSEAVAGSTAAPAEDAELKLVAANESKEVSEQATSVDSGGGKDLALAQESIQALTQENLELKDRLQESEALLGDLKRLLSLKDDELASLQEQLAAAQTSGTEEPAATEEMPTETEEAAPPAAEEEMPTEAEEAAPAAEEEAPATEEEDMEVVETEPAPSSVGIMGMVEQYIAPVKDILKANPMYGIGAAVVLVVLILIVVLMRFKKNAAETMHIETETVEAFPDFDSGDLGDTGEDIDSEAATVLPDSEAETAMPEESVDIDLDLEGEEEEAKTQFIAPEETPEEEEEEDPLQEVNTYLAFEQFDQAEEFVRNAITNDPDNAEFHTKLLEVFYTSGNKKSYEEEAKVLNELVGGQGEHWNMAVAMWSEMSPNRALFEEGSDEDESAAETTGGGFVDVTADDEASDNNDLDFDIGAGGDEPSAASTAGEAEEEMLDITASDEGEDILDVTAAIGLDEVDTAESSTDDDVLDISSSSGGADDLLDVTSSEESTGEDLLDVTAAANLELDTDEDLLDVTAATSAGADSSELLDLDIESDAEKGEPEPASENETVEFDLGVSGSGEEAAETAEDNVIDFDLVSGGSDEESLSIDDDSATGAGEISDSGLEIDLGEAEAESDAGLDLDLGEVESTSETGSEIDLGEAEAESDAGLDFDLGEVESTSETGSEIDLEEAEEPIRLDIEDDADTESSEGSGLSIDLDVGNDEGIELDLSEEDSSLSLDSDESSSPGLSLEESEEATIEANISDMDFDLSIDEPAEDSEEPKIDLDLDGTVEIPKSAAVPEEDDEEEDHTVFVPRAAQPEEQSVEDEIATKLDLAKAYVELGDKDSAKAILDEVMADGNAEQQKQAKDLLGQI